MRAPVQRSVRFGVAELIQDPARPGEWTVAVDDVLQSYVDLADPTHLAMRFTTWIAALLDRHWEPGRAISAAHVGGAGCTLPRYLAATRPGSAQTVFELDGELVDLVREYLDLDSVPGLRVRVQDGRAGIAALPEATTDALVLDAFRGGEVAAELATVESLRAMARPLAPGGLCVANLWDRGDGACALRAAAAFDAVFDHAVLVAEAGVLAQRRPGNVVLAGSTAELALADLAERTSSAPTPVFCRTPAQLEGMFGHAAPLAETDPLDGPAPSVLPRHLPR